MIEGVPCRTSPLLHWIDLKALKLKKDGAYKENDKAADKVIVSPSFSVCKLLSSPPFVRGTAHSVLSAAAAGCTHGGSERQRHSGMRVLHQQMCGGATAQSRVGAHTCRQDQENQVQVRD